MNLWDAIATGCVSVTFAVAIASKVQSRAAFDDFSQGLRQLGIDRRWHQLSVAVAVVTAETAALSALLGRFAPTAVRFGFSALLLILFTVAMIVAARRNTVVVCHCFGASQTTRVSEHVLMNLWLVALSGAAALSTPPGGLGAGGTVLAVGVGLLCGVFLVSLDVLRAALGLPNSVANKRMVSTLR